MMLRKQTILFPLFLIAAGVINVSSQNVDSITLPLAIGLAVKNSAALNAAQQGLAAAKAKTSQAKSAWFPSANGVVSYANIGPLEKLNIPIGGGKTALFQLYPEDNWDIHAGADYVLFDFGKRGKTVQLSRIGEEALQTGTGLAAKAVAYQTIVMFEALLGSVQMIAAKQENIANLSQHLDFVKKKLSTGSTTEFEVLRSEVQLTNSQTELTNLLNDLTKQHIDFRFLLGLPESATVRCAGAFDSSFREPPVDSLADAALKQRTEIDLLNLGIKAAQTQLSLARADLAPALTAHVSGGAKNGYIPNLDQLEWNWVAGAQITAPIFDGRRSHYHVKELESHIDSLRTILADLRRRVRIDVLKAVADVKSAHLNVAEAADNVRLAGESRRIATLQYEAGAITNLDLLDAEDKYTQAKFARVQSEFRYTLSRYALMEMTGFDFTELSKGAENK